MAVTKMKLLSVARHLQTGRQRLAGCSENASLDSAVLLAWALGAERSWLLAHPEAEVSEAVAGAYAAGLARLESGEPLAYILGEWEFFGLKLQVTPAVLIPRPETELLVEAALAWLAAHPGRRRAADVGTGSGCIPVALAVSMPDLHIIAGDLSSEALAVAQANVERYNLQARVHLVKSDLLANMAGPFDVICANLPYIPEARLPERAVSKWEPRIALGGGEDGLRFIGPFLRQAQAKTAPQALILAEIDAGLQGTVSDLALGLWPAARITIRPDLAGLPRLLIVET
ncbi:MAG TPA: peptide chain release factor N(5)-glutamine methyltransferase [Anaerolineales bacterium]|nr:peptide chain release factor N(5)-glutamine methyltransferase [Anaerolineales bacterium]